MRANFADGIGLRGETKSKYGGFSTATAKAPPCTPTSKCARWGPRAFGRDDVVFVLTETLKYSREGLIEFLKIPSGAKAPFYMSDLQRG